MEIVKLFKLGQTDVQQLVSIIALIALCGAFGGIAGGLYNHKRMIKPSLDSFYDLIPFGLSGIVSAFGIIVLVSCVGNLFCGSETKTGVVLDGLYMIGLSVLSGFFSMRLLPHIGNQLEQKVAEQDKKLLELARDNKKVARYNILISYANVAFQSNNDWDIDQAIENLEHGVGEFPLDRTLNIYLGRLYRRKKRFKDAIITLVRFISAMKEAKAITAPIGMQAIAVALFNIACYHILMVTEGGSDEKVRLFNEAENFLREAVKYDTLLKPSIPTDKDLLPFLEERKDFFASLP